MPHPGYRIFVLGAGFSRPAGLPLADELFSEIKRRVESRHGTDTKFGGDLEDYLRYRKRCHEIDESSPIDFEAFMSYLDIEHFLELRGSKTWSHEGNESQLMMRRGIGELISERTPQSDRLPDVYYRFAESLSPHDTIITFNYDILLERALDHIGKPYRLFPHRYKTISRHGGGTVDDSIEEVTIFKLHGSIDWFDDRGFIRSRDALNEQGTSGISIHTVFDDPSRYGASPIVDGLRPEDDPLLHIHRIRESDRYYAEGKGFNSPFILSPSHVKFVYSEPLLSLWSGLGRAGGLNLGLGIIGFSLPEHDEYIRVGLYQLAGNYQFIEWDTDLLGVKKDNVKLVDYRTDDGSIAQYMGRYSFIDPDRASFSFSGFTEESVRFIFESHR